MVSNYSPGVILAWQIAANEAIGGGHDRIQREHLLIGLAKAEEVFTAAEAGAITAKFGDAQNLKEELRCLGDCFRQQGVDVEKARRRARYLVGQGTGTQSRPDVIHRSEDCREAFAKAVSFAEERSSRAHSLHLLAGLLEKPGVLVAQAVGFGGGDVQALQKAALKAMNAVSPGGSPGGSGNPSGMLDLYGVDLTQLAQQGKIEPLVGRKKELLQLIRTLSRKTKNNPILLGEPGVGKTALVRALAQQLIQGHAPAALQGKRIIELNLGTLVAGTKYRGEFEERLTRVIAEVKGKPEIILFMDEIHTMVGAGAGGGGLDAANILKPALSGGGFRCIGSTTLSEYRKYFEKDAALSRRFFPLVVEEPSPEETLRILEGLREHYEKHHGVQISPSALKGAVEFLPLRVGSELARQGARFTRRSLRSNENRLSDFPLRGGRLDHRRHNNG